MRVLGIVLKRPKASYWATFDWVAGCGAAGLLVGMVIQQIIGGSFNPVFAMGVAGAVTGVLVACGADLARAGWRGAGLCIMCAMVAFWISVVVSAP